MPPLPPRGLCGDPAHGLHPESRKSSPGLTGKPAGDRDPRVGASTSSDPHATFLLLGWERWAGMDTRVYRELV